MDKWMDLSDCGWHNSKQDSGHMPLWSCSLLKLLEKIAALGIYTWLLEFIFATSFYLHGWFPVLWFPELLDWSLASIYFSIIELLQLFLVSIASDKHVCSDKRGTHIRMNLIGFCFRLLHCWRHTAQRICTSLFLHRECPHRGCWGIASVKNSGRQRHTAKSMLQYFLFPLKIDVKSNKKFLSMLPKCIINIIDMV